MEELEATVDGTVYRNADNGYSVVSVSHGKREVTVVGILPELSAGEQVCFQGEWVEHPSYGKQFKCSAWELRKPTTLLGIERYLGSGIIRGVGPTTAKAIVRTFGTETLEILSEHPERLQEVPGMGKKRWMQIAEGYRETQGAREAMIFLQSYGVPANLSMKISKKYGERTGEMIRQNPYRLCDEMEGVGFQTADRIAMSMGIAADSEYRIGAGLRFVLSQAAAGMGHTCLPRGELLRQTANLLRIAPEMAEHVLMQQILKHEVVTASGEEDDLIYLPAFDSAEREVASRLCELLAAVLPQKDTRVDRNIARFEHMHGISFSEHQKDAIRSAMEHGVLVITGGPGTGKTTIINCIISLLARDQDVLLCAPTGRAAKRMTEATGVESKTIHRLLEYSGEDGSFARNQEEPLEADVVIVDETSMVDLMLMRSLLRAMEPGMRLILVGDSDQLPSVGAGNVLDDILTSGVIPAVRLTDIFRQSETSRIVVNAHRINHGEMPLLNEKNTDFFFERRETFSQTAASIVQLLTQRLPGYLKFDPKKKLEQSIRSIQVLTPTRKGDCGILQMNPVLQEALNPPDRRKPCFERGETLYRLGDKVMQTKNDYQITWRKQTARGWEEGEGVFNGDVGFITEVDPEERTLTVLFDEEREVVYSDEQLENLELAYCMTVHKSQGSEFPVVVMPVAGGPDMLLTRNLFYTALTRARSLVVLVGREDVIRRMVENDHILKRYTTLKERICHVAQLIPGN